MSRSSTSRASTFVRCRARTRRRSRCATREYACRGKAKVEQQPPPQAQAVEQAEGRAVIACPACGEDVARDARFCDVCGFELESPPAGTAEAEADGRRSEERRVGKECRSR